VNLDSWVLPQKGSILHPAVPRISLYLFRSILHLPKLESLTIYTECSDAQEILDFVGPEEGIQLCQFWSMFEPPQAGDMTFHICRKKFSLDHNQLKTFMDSNRPDPAAMADNNNNMIIEHFVRYLFEEGNVEHWIALEDWKRKRNIQRSYNLLIASVSSVILNVKKKKELSVKMVYFLISSLLLLYSVQNMRK